MVKQLINLIRQSLEKLRIAFLSDNPKAEISNLDISQIRDDQMIIVEEGTVFYKKTQRDPLDFSSKTQTTFLSSVPSEWPAYEVCGAGSGGNYMALDVYTVMAEKNGCGVLYELKVAKDIDRILDLSKVCEDQKIETEYLKIHETLDGRNPELERKLFDLYGHKINELRIHGVKYRSRRNPKGYCIVFYDTLLDFKSYFSTPEKLDEAENRSSILSWSPNGYSS